MRGRAIREIARCPEGPEAGLSTQSTSDLDHISMRQGGWLQERALRFGTVVATHAK